MKTVIALNNSGGELQRIELSERDATTQAIARAVIDLVNATGMSMSEGDSITVTEVGVVDQDTYDRQWEKDCVEINKKIRKR